MPQGSRPALVLCGDIRHTLGATEYAWLSFLAIALRVRKEVAAPIEVYMPLSLGGLRADMTVTRSSLSSIGRRYGFTMSLSEPVSCDHDHNDVRVTDRMSAGGTMVIPPLPTYTEMVERTQRNLYPQQHLDVFLQGMMSHLRAATAAETSTQQRSNSPLRVSLSLVQATPGPLAHFGALLHEESLELVRALEIAPPPTATAAGSECAYVFLGLHLGVGLIELKTTQQIQHFQFSIAVHIVRAAKDAGLRCATLNAVFARDGGVSQSIMLDVFAASRLNVSVVTKHSFKGPMEQWRQFYSGQRGADTGIRPTAELLENLGERYASYTSPLLITQSGTYWSDWVLAKRAAEGRPSLVLANPESRRGTHATRACGGALGSASDACSDCVFYRGHCATGANRWLELMAKEMALCTPRYQENVTQGRLEGKGIQKVAVVGC